MGTSDPLHQSHVFLMISIQNLQLVELVQLFPRLRTRKVLNGGLLACHGGRTRHASAVLDGFGPRVFLRVLGEVRVAH